MPNKNNEQKKYHVHNQSRMYKDLKTEKQWLQTPACNILWIARSKNSARC